ncbi:hypothetical protein M3212_08025 [Alkalihalobacillus oceani]|uniref:hypothetical protein n=1 Tax=Halalkalibacter oceani TaxID=1653776 RepID=UPI00203BF4C6|nr:hypothetical protein [Halalkalibacter oceani]MCM3760734.1 hypothetical protein [Halalkalibacter oceani]
MRKRKGGGKLTTIRLKDLETRVKKNNKKYKKAISSFQEETKSKGMIAGRVRPKHPTEAKILSMFQKKK